MTDEPKNDSHEIEVKLIYREKSKLVDWLKKNGFEFFKKKEIKDSYYGIAGSFISGVGSFYRIREIVGEYAELTLKDSFHDTNGVKTRREINVSIDDPHKMDIILSTLNCKIFKENASKREYWKKANITLEFIDYYQPAKLEYVEIEGPSPEAVHKVINSLGDNISVAGEEIFAEFDKK